jgi:hypothetical protein
MSVSFCAYIDESGDEGFKFRTAPDEEASSDWFVLSAFITRKKTDIQTVRIIDKVRSELNYHPRKHIHWKKLKHPQKVRYAQHIASTQTRTIAVCVHKPSLMEPEKFSERYRLYFYAVRYLMERISWLVRDKHNPEKWGGDGTAESLFSNRQGMSYEEMRDYLRLLKKQQQSGQDIRIDFEKIPIDNLRTQTPGKSMGLQLADAVAGAFFNALDRDKFGNTEPRYVQTMSPVLYRENKNLQGYGFKIVPREALSKLENEESLKWLATFK